MRPRVVMAVMAAAIVVVGASSRPASASAPTDQLRTQIDRVLKVLDDAELKKNARVGDRRAAIRKIANDIFDFHETTRRCLGVHWQGRTPAEREEFVGLFADLLERSYIGRIETYSGERIQFLGDVMDGDQAVVRTKLVTKQGTEIPVDYRMHRRGDRWLTYDVAIEGVSLVSNYRAQFNRIITTSSYAELVRKLKAKQEEGLGADATVRRTSQHR